MINIVLADDHELVRNGVKSLLSIEPDFKIVGEVEDGLEAVSLVEKIKPDILVLDMTMPGMNGLEVAFCLNSRGCKTCIVILSMQNGDAYVSQALSFGVKGYVLKESPPEELTKAIREAVAGRRYLCSMLADHA
jgi:DNA-binding NarL/FixJ family response regulator